jgi:hypothetical protein
MSRFWTGEEVKVLRELWFMGVPMSQLLASLPGRTEDGCRNRARSLGLVRASAHGTPWSNSEDAALRRIWSLPGSLKTHLGLFPGRTHRAVMDRGRHLGLGPRGAKLHATNYSWVRDEIKRLILANGPMSSNELAHAICATQSHVHSLLNAGRGSCYYVAEWVQPRAVGNGSLRQKWALGNQPDAPKPALKPAILIRRDYRERQRIKRGQINPFASLAMQVAA